MTMTMTDALIAELRQEGATTRRILERLPDDKLTWKPHARSMSLGGLALHVADIPGALAELFSELDREAPVVPLPQPASRAEILAAFDKGLATAESRLGPPFMVPPPTRIPLSIPRRLVRRSCRAHLDRSGPEPALNL